MIKYREWDTDFAREEVKEFLDLRGGLLPALKAIQGTFGHVPEAARHLLADLFNLSRAEVLGVVHFYDDFRDQPPARLVVKVCAAEACQAVGGADLLEAARSLETIEVEEVFCLGNCACGPSVMIGETVFGRLGVGGVAALVSNWEEGGGDE